MLVIFLIVLGVIGTFVVPPIQKVLGEREAMVAKTTDDNRKAVEQEAAAESDYHKEMAAARTEASGIRDEARAEGRAVLDDKRGHANEEAAGDAAGSCRAAQAAERRDRGGPEVVGGDTVGRRWPAGSSVSRFPVRRRQRRDGRSMSTFIGQLIGFLVIIWIIWRYAVPPVRRLMASQQETVRNQLDESAKAAQRLADADKHHAQRVDEAKAEAKHITEEARVDAERIGEQLRAQADVEVERIKVQGGQQVSAVARPDRSVSCARTWVPSRCGARPIWSVRTSPIRGAVGHRRPLPGRTGLDGARGVHPRGVVGSALGQP